MLEGPTSDLSDGDADTLVSMIATLRPSEDSANVLLAALAHPRLVKDERPNARRASIAAVAALLRLGHPWALKIEPRDLAWFREQQAKWTPGRIVAAGLGALGAVPALSFAVEVAGTRSVQVALLGTFAGLQMLGALIPWMRDPKRQSRRVWIPAAALALASVFTMEGALIVRSVLLAVLIGTEFALLSLLHPEYLDPARP